MGDQVFGLSRQQALALGFAGYQNFWNQGFPAQLAPNQSLLALPPMQWSISHTPGAAQQASLQTNIGPGGAGHQLVITSIDAALIIPPGANQPAITLDLAAFGGGGIVWSRQFGVGAVVAAGLMQTVSLSGLAIAIDDGQQALLEFSAAGVAGTYQSLSMTGYLV